MKSGLALIVSLSFFIIGLLFYLFNELNLICPRSGFGGNCQTDFFVWLTGFLLVALGIPLLYSSAYKNFLDKKKVWFLEMILVFPFILIGFLFQIGLGALVTFPLSAIILVVTNIIFFVKAIKNIPKSPFLLIIIALLIYIIFLISLPFLAPSRLSDLSDFFK